MKTIKIESEFKIPGTDVVLEKGDVISVRMKEGVKPLDSALSLQVQASVELKKSLLALKNELVRILGDLTSTQWTPEEKLSQIPGDLRFIIRSNFQDLN